MTDLSPQVNEILKAAYKATRNPQWQTNFYSSYAAAVLRTAANQLRTAYANEEYVDSAEDYLDDIATELEKAND
jgi:hypothetical protein